MAPDDELRRRDRGRPLGLPQHGHSQLRLHDGQPTLHAHHGLRRAPHAVCRMQPPVRGGRLRPALRLLHPRGGRRGHLLQRAGRDGLHRHQRHDSGHLPAPRQVGELGMLRARVN